MTSTCPRAPILTVQSFLISFAICAVPCIHLYAVNKAVILIRKRYFPEHHYWGIFWKTMFELREIVRYGQEHSETYANQFRSHLTVKSHILHVLHNIDDMDVNNRGWVNAPPAVPPPYGLVATGEVSVPGPTYY